MNDTAQTYENCMGLCCFIYNAKADAFICIKGVENSGIL